MDALSRDQLRKVVDGPLVTSFNVFVLRAGRVVETKLAPLGLVAMVGTCHEG